MRVRDMCRRGGDAFTRYPGSLCVSLRQPMAEGSVPGPSAHAAGEARGAAAAPRASGTVPDTDGDDGEANATSVCAGRRNFWQDRQPGGNKASSQSLHGSRTETALLNCGGDVRACRFRASATKWTAAAAAARRAKRLLDCCQADHACNPVCR